MHQLPSKIVAGSQPGNSPIFARCGLVLAFLAGLAAFHKPLMADDDRQPELLVLMHESGTIERYHTSTGQHLGTLIQGLPPSNAILADTEGRILISTGLPGSIGSVLRFDPRGGTVETLLQVPEGYGGRLFRATGMAWRNGDLLVASQGDGRVKRYTYPTGEWQDDVVLASPGGITQIAVHKDRLYLTDFTANAIRRAPWTLDGTMADTWLSGQGQAPWGLAIADDSSVFWSTSSNRIFRTSADRTQEWAGIGGGLATPIGLELGPDGFLYVANLAGKVNVWSSESPNMTGPLRTLGGDEMRQPISLIFLSHDRTEKFVWKPAAQFEATPEKLAFFEAKVRPLLQTRCLDCHGSDSQEAGLRLDFRQAWEVGGITGPAIVQGKPEDSLLMAAVRYLDKDLRMPPDRPLSVDETELFRQWIADGAVDPRNGTVAPVTQHASAWESEFRKRLDWWSLKPPVLAQPPTAADPVWNQSGIDQWVYSSLGKAGLTPVPQADPDVLVRRMSVVLTGLPPTPELQQEFQRRWHQGSQPALSWLADSLLNSPHFGEHFARHWMDCVRYTDTYGYEWDNPAKGSWEYRDYLIRAFNEDVPYDTLVREQLAGDLLSSPRIHQQQHVNESLIGPMFYHLGEHRHGSSLQFNGIHQEMMNNKIDAFSRVFLATTVACARCHDHKLEAVSQKDYYALGAVFMTPRWASRPIDDPASVSETIEQLKNLRTEIRMALAGRWSQQPVTLDALQRVVADQPAAPAIDDVTWPVAALLADRSKMVETWSRLEQEWLQTRDTRAAASMGFQTQGELGTGKLPDGWVMEGAGFEHGSVPDGTPRISLQGNSVIAQFLPAGLHSHALSPKLPGVLRMPPQHQVPGRHVSVKLAGGEFAGTLILDENALQNESVAFLKQDEPSWRTYTDADLKNGVTRVTVDFATASLNPNFPPRTGVAPGLPNDDPGYDKQSWISICGISLHDAAGVPPESLNQYHALFMRGTPRDPEDAELKLLGWLNECVNRWGRNETSAADRVVLQWLLNRGLIQNAVDSTPELTELVRRYRELEQTLRLPRTVNSMDERLVAKHGAYLNIRGNVDTPGEFVAPDFLSAFAGKNTVAAASGSGRLELAESLLAPDHPLTARVYVNRLWQWIFGTGLVASPDDFGRLGDRPSHPELLDWLAHNLIQNGWSTKQIVRQMILSQTFLQSGIPASLATERDPMNRLRHHYPTRRMDAESIRDAMLLVSGRLDPQLYGRPINPVRTVEDSAKRLFSGPLDGNGRRSLYLTMSIMDPPKFLKTFDLPDLKLPTGRRSETSVPGQSLLMLNDPLVHLLADQWSSRLCSIPHATAEERITQMFLQAFSRRPSDEELRAWKALVDEFAGTNEQQTNSTAWAAVAHTIFNTAEFLYYR